jgi:hypothetical protein
MEICNSFRHARRHNVAFIPGGTHTDKFVQEYITSPSEPQNLMYKWGEKSNSEQLILL